MKRSVLVSFLVCACIFVSCEKKSQNAVAVPSPIPAQSDTSWLMAHIDVETTGLIPGYHEMIDMGMVMTDLKGNPIDSLFLRIQTLHPERLQKGAYDCNAYDFDKWQEMGAIHPDTAVKRIIAFHKRVSNGKQVLMVAHNCQFDSAFMDHLFRHAEETWRDLYYYYILDIPSMCWGLGVTREDIMKLYSIEDEPHVAKYHTGITGAALNARVYRGILKYRAEYIK